MKFKTTSLLNATFLTSFGASSLRLSTGQWLSSSVVVLTGDLFNRHPSKNMALDSFRESFV